MSRRGLGWLPDADGVVEAELASKPLAKLLGLPRASMMPTAIDYCHLLDKIPDQGPTSSCVGQAFATALYITAKIEGNPIPRPSAKLIYDDARAEDQPYINLVDTGSRPLAAMRCLVEMGMVAESDWPIIIQGDFSNINIKPVLDVYQKALAYRVGSYYRIPGGVGAADGLRHALARGYCPIFAMPVDEAYENFSGPSIYPGRKGTSLGGHMQAIAGYGDGFFRIPSSWGTTHGNGGIVKIAADYFDSGECTDLLVTTIVPTLAE